MADKADKNKKFGWALIICLGLAVLGFMFMGSSEPDRVTVNGKDIHFKIEQMESNSPKSFNALVAVDAAGGELPGKLEFQAVVRAVADNSLMRIAAVDQWWIGLVLAGQEGNRPFVLYHYVNKTDQLDIKWSPENLPPKYRGRIKAGLDTDVQ